MLRKLGAVGNRKLSLLLSAAVALSGCNVFRLATGQIKAPFDEFAISTFAPLVVPPDGSLRLPQPGRPARNYLLAAERGRSILFPQTVNTASSTGPEERYSDGEAFLLRMANIDVPSPEIVGAIMTTAAIFNSHEGPSLRRSFDR